METFPAFVIQYLRPNGRESLVYTELPEIFHNRYEDMEKAKCRLEAEVLTTGEVSVTVFNYIEGEDIDIEVIPNGPEVQDAICRMLVRAKWLERVENVSG